MASTHNGLYRSKFLLKWKNAVAYPTLILSDTLVDSPSYPNRALGSKKRASFIVLASHTAFLGLNDESSGRRADS